MTRIAAQRFNFLTSGLVLVGLLLSTASPLAADLGADVEAVPLRLKSSVTIDAELIKLGDIFTGLQDQADIAIAESPAPGQRLTLPAEWLGRIAKSHDIAWQPTTTFDRVVVFRPGQNIAANDILAAVVSELESHGVTQNYRLKLNAPLPMVTIPSSAPKAIAIREAFFDPATNNFSAVAEIPANHPRAQFIQLKGEAYAVAMTPVLKQSVSRDTVITADMLDMVELPQSKISSEAVLDRDSIIGQAAKNYLRPGQPLRAIDIHHVTFVTVPVFRTEMRRGTQIAESHIDWIEVNSTDLPVNAVLDSDQLIGQTPKRQLAAGLPLRTTDVQTIELVEVPVAARELRRGETLTAEDLQWTTMDRRQLVTEVVSSQDNLVGYVTNTPVRAGQPFRQHSVALPIAIQKNTIVTLIYSVPAMKLTAKAKVLENAAIGQIVRVTNVKSNTNLYAEVIDADTVRVTEQQNAMN